MLDMLVIASICYWCDASLGTCLVIMAAWYVLSVVYSYLKA